MMLRPAWRVGGVCAIVGGVLIHLTLGNLYSFSNMMTYMVSYMHERVDPSVTYANILWVNAITTMSQGLFMVMGGLMEKRAGPRLTCLLGCSLLSAGIILTRYTVEMSLFAVILTYGLLSGLGISLAYTTPLSCGMQWFPGHKGLINGLIVAGFGLGALGSTNLQTMYLNPQNKPPQSDGYFVESSILDRVPSVFVLLGVIFLVMQFIGCVLLRRPPQNKAIIHYQQEGESLLVGEVKREELDMQTTTTTTTSTTTTTTTTTTTSTELGLGIDGRALTGRKETPPKQPLVKLSKKQKKLRSIQANTVTQAAKTKKQTDVQVFDYAKKRGVNKEWKSKKEEQQEEMDQSSVVSKFEPLDK